MSDVLELKRRDPGKVGFSGPFLYGLSCYVPNRRKLPPLRVAPEAAEPESIVVRTGRYSFTCAICRKPFVTENAEQPTCSRTCGQILRTRRKMAAIADAREEEEARDLRDRGVGGAESEKDRTAKARRAAFRRASLTGEMRPCVICKTPFAVKRHQPTQAACGGECGAKWRLQKLAETKDRPFPVLVPEPVESSEPAFVSEKLGEEGFA